jgi:uncharacterized glyoxalase superfamily protein PhnB
MTFTSVTPYLRYPDGDAAYAWLHRVLGFGPERVHRDGDGAWSEGTVAVGDGRVDITAGPAVAQERDNGQGLLLIVGVTDVDAQYRRIRDAGVDIAAPKDEPYGPCSCHVSDPWGYRWYFWQGEAKY